MSLDVTIKDRVCTLQLLRPARHNALDHDLIRDLKDALLSAETDPRVKVILIRGSEDHFCTGIDVQYLADTQPLDLDRLLLEVGHVVELFLRIHKHKKLVIAEVNGPALGSGCTLALAADFVLAADDAPMGYPDVQWGFVPAVSIPLLRQRLTPGILRRLMLTGVPMMGDELLQAGLADRLLPRADLAEAAHKLALQLATDTSPGSVELTKRLLADLADMPAKEAFNFAARIATHSRKTVEYEIGIKALLQKQRPEW